MQRSETPGPQLDAHRNDYTYYILMPKCDKETVMPEVVKLQQNQQVNAEIENMQRIFQAQKSAHLKNMLPTVKQRKTWLKTLKKTLLNHIDDIVKSIHADFEQRSAYETKILEIVPSVESIKYTIKHLKNWMRPQRKRVSIWFKPAKALLMPQPLGVVGIIVPWNYPIYLALGPLISALSAGNRVMIKMSESTPKTGETLANIIGECFAEDLVAVINGDVKVSEQFTQLPFDHILFTGSAAIGRKVMRQASENLTPVTLELGGKSPAIIGPEPNAEKYIQRLFMGKFFNAGQTCVAPDYVLLPKDKKQMFIEKAKYYYRRYYPKHKQYGDRTTLINQRHYQRLQSYLAQAKQQNAKLIELDESQSLSHERHLNPQLIFNLESSSKLLQEEIFGNLLPVVTYDTLNEVLTYINSKPRPLALYYFGHDKNNIKRVVENTIAGGVAINDTILQISQDVLPFGGVGDSGMGHYHGYEGFKTFSKLKPIFIQSRISSFEFLYPPYNRFTDFILKLMLR
ncbi:MAG: coniferyl aldehyde dehydrogenase [Pseudomonadota bacterium]